jgi:hypothetical protein
MRVPIITSALAALAVGGCLSGSDGGNVPNERVQEAADATAARLSENAVGITTDLLEGVPRWLEDFRAPGRTLRETATWSPTERAWILEGSLAYEDVDASGTIVYATWVQFLADGKPQHWVNDADIDQVGAVWDATISGSYHPPGFQVAHSWRAIASLNATMNGDGSTTYYGAGSLDGSTATTIEGRVFDHTQEVLWEYDLGAVPGATCASGALEGGWDAYAFEATFDAAGSVDWWLDRRHTRLATREAAYACTP